MQQELEVKTACQVADPSRLSARGAASPNNRLVVSARRNHHWIIPVLSDY